MHLIEQWRDIYDTYRHQHPDQTFREYLVRVSTPGIEWLTSYAAEGFPDLTDDEVNAILDRPYKPGDWITEDERRRLKSGDPVARVNAYIDQP